MQHERDVVNLLHHVINNCPPGTVGLVGQAAVGLAGKVQETVASHHGNAEVVPAVYDDTEEPVGLIVCPVSG